MDFPTRIETARFQMIARLQVIFGLDTADEHCLLDQQMVSGQTVK